MLSRVRSAVASLVGGFMPATGSSGERASGADLPLKFPYVRPEFLGLSPDEVECSTDHMSRPIVILKETKRLPWATGYAEVINAGKSAVNEDQACCEVMVVKKRPTGFSSPCKPFKRRSSMPNGESQSLAESLPQSEELLFHYWALFDGHAGSGAAVMASRLLHQHIVKQLQEIVDVLCNLASHPPTVLGDDPDHTSTPCIPRALTRASSLRSSPSTTPRFFTEKKIQHESLVMGALENAFKNMDIQIERDKSVYNIMGGCTALVVVFIQGKLYVANAGDSRAIIIKNGEIMPMSAEFTPESERQRLQFLGYMQPHLLGGEFTHLEFPRRVQRKEVGRKMLYRDFTMSGWAYKTIEDEDLRFPLIYGEGKKVTRIVHGVRGIKTTTRLFRHYYISLLNQLMLRKPKDAG